MIVTGNTMSGTNYDIACANCGGSLAERCEAVNNVISPRGTLQGSGIDLNRGHFALVQGNTITGSDYRGFSADDTRNATITQNTIAGSRYQGIVLANGAEPGNRPCLSRGASCPTTR